MKTDIKQRWLNALRSGEYQQTQECLRDSDGYCCMGVLCDLHAQETGREWEEDHYMGEEVFLPEEVVVWAGLPNDNPELNYNRGIQSLGTLNDGHKWGHVAALDFNSISDLIEEQL